MDHFDSTDYCQDMLEHARGMQNQRKYRKGEPTKRYWNGRVKYWEIMLALARLKAREEGRGPTEREMVRERTAHASGRMHAGARRNEGIIIEFIT